MHTNTQLVVMEKSVQELQNIYLCMMSDTASRLEAANCYLEAYNQRDAIYDLESSILQMRKALENVAYAAICPNKSEYEKFRASSEDQPDFRKDFNATKILNLLSKVNKNFYPLPILPAIEQEDGIKHFGRKETGYLSKKKFSKFYDRLGKYLHADNPWANEKQIQNLANDIPNIIKQVYSLLELHVTFIQSDLFKGCWVVSVEKGKAPVIIAGQAGGEFLVNDN